jgi:3-hydroxyisobutyrate dehydrogenase
MLMPADAPRSTIAFIGLGMMGSPMAACLARAGYHLRLFDASPAALSAFLEKTPGLACSSAAAAAAGAEVVITVLPDGSVVRDAVLGEPDGAVFGLRPGAVVIDMSSSSPIDTQRLGPALSAYGIGLIDAPVSGGVKRAADGKLAIMAGGDPTLIERCRFVFDALGSSLALTGPLGSGHAMKSLNNFLAAVSLVATSEALIIGRRFGLDPNTMIDILNVSTGRSFATEVNAKQCILSNTFESGFMLGLLAKDVRIAAELADHLDLKAPLVHSESDLWEQAEKALGPRTDHTMIYRYLEQLLGTP